MYTDDHGSLDFAGNEQETHRLTIDSLIQERPLREIYLRPFEIAVREANPWALMTSYNLINGVHADMNELTLRTILRGEWQYDGYVLFFSFFFLLAVEVNAVIIDRHPQHGYFGLGRYQFHRGVHRHWL